VEKKASASSLHLQSKEPPVRCGGVQYPSSLLSINKLIRSTTQYRGVQIKGQGHISEIYRDVELVLALF